MISKQETEMKEIGTDKTGLGGETASETGGGVI